MIRLQNPQAKPATTQPLASTSQPAASQPALALTTEAPAYRDRLGEPLREEKPTRDYPSEGLEKLRKGIEGIFAQLPELTVPLDTKWNKKKKKK